MPDLLNENGIKCDLEKELKILAIGNSFSDDALWLLPEILKSLGVKKFRVSNLYVPGCLLEIHLNNIQNDKAVYEFRTNTGGGWYTVFETKLIDGINADDWNYITFQQGSPKSGISESYLSLLEIISFVKKLKPKAKFGWHMTWAYQQDFSSVAFVENYCAKQSIMYNLIVNSVKNNILANDDIKFIVPNGTAIQNARTSYLGDTLTRDGFHMSYDVGRYIVALSYAYFLTNCELFDVSYKPDSINEEVKKICIESVKNALDKPFEITCSSYKSLKG